MCSANQSISETELEKERVERREGEDKGGGAEGGQRGGELVRCEECKYIGFFSQLQ